MQITVGKLFSNIVERSGDSRDFTMHEIAIHLAQAVLDTGVPKEYWNLEVDPVFQKAFNLPVGVRFNVGQ